MKYYLIKDKELICTKCNLPFKCSRHKYYKNTQKSKINKSFGCFCDKCKPKPIKSRKCIVCNTITKNPKFCSNSCAAKFNNKGKQKNPPK